MYARQMRVYLASFIQNGWHWNFLQFVYYFGEFAEGFTSTRVLLCIPQVNWWVLRWVLKLLTSTFKPYRCANLNCLRWNKIVSTLLSTNRLIAIYQIIFVCARIHPLLGSTDTRLYAKYGQERRMFEYFMIWFRFVDPKPPLCSASMRRFCAGTSTGH